MQDLKGNKVIGLLDFAQQCHSACKVQYDPLIVSALNISDASQTFLIEAGLPCYAFKTVFDLPPNNLPYLSEANLPYDFPEHLRHLRLIGKTWHGLDPPFDFICLDEKVKGHVKIVLNEAGFPCQLLNTSVVHMAEMVLLCEVITQWWSTQEAQNYNEFERRNHQTAAKLRQIDPEALSENRGWTEAILCIQAGM